jgi:hypothetical protein
VPSPHQVQCPLLLRGSLLPARGLREQHTGRAGSHKSHRGTSLRRCTPGLAGLCEVLVRNETAQVSRRCWYFDLTPVRPHRICVRLVRCPLTQTFWQGRDIDSAAIVEEGGRCHGLVAANEGRTREQASNMLCANGCRVLLLAVCTAPGSASVTPPPLQPDCARSKSKCWKHCPTGKSTQHCFRYPKNSGWRSVAPTSTTSHTRRAPHGGARLHRGRTRLCESLLGLATEQGFFPNRQLPGAGFSLETALSHKVGTELG